MKFYVVREHLGDRFYKPGETREAAEGDVKHLIGSVLSREPVAAKSDARRLNKSEQPDANKSDSGTTTPKEAQPDDLADLTKAELVAVAEAEGVPVEPSAKKSEIADAIRTSRAAKDN